MVKVEKNPKQAKGLGIKGAKYTKKTCSRDESKTWTLPHYTPFPTATATLAALHDDNECCK